MANTSIKEINVDLAAVKTAIDKQSEYLDGRITFVARLVFGVYAVVGTVIGGGFLLRSDLGDIKAEVRATGAQISFIREDVARVEKRMDNLEKILAAAPTGSQNSPSRQAVALQLRLEELLNRLEKLPSVQPKLLSAQAPSTVTGAAGGTGSVAGLALTDEDRAIIRATLKLDSDRTKRPPKYSVGQSISETADVPDYLLKVLPKLKGLRFALDPDNGAALFVDARDRIVAMVI